MLFQSFKVLRFPIQSTFTEDVDQSLPVVLKCQTVPLLKVRVYNYNMKLASQCLYHDYPGCYNIYRVSQTMRFTSLEFTNMHVPLPIS